MKKQEVQDILNNAQIKFERIQIEDGDYVFREEWNANDYTTKWIYHLYDKDGDLKELKASSIFIDFSPNNKYIGKNQSFKIRPKNQKNNDNAQKKKKGVRGRKPLLDKEAFFALCENNSYSTAKMINECVSNPKFGKKSYSQIESYITNLSRKYDVYLRS